MYTVSEDLTCKKAHEAIVKFEIFSGITMIICSSSSYGGGRGAGCVRLNDGARGILWQCGVVDGITLIVLSGATFGGLSGATFGGLSGATFGGLNGVTSGVASEIRALYCGYP